MPFTPVGAHFPPIDSKLSQRRAWCLVGWLAPVLTLLVLLPANARGDDEELRAQLERMEQIIRQQQADLDAQQKQLADQLKLIRQLQQQASAKQEPQPAAPAPELAQEQPSSPEATAAGSPKPESTAETAPSEGQVAAVQELERRQEEGTAQPEVTAQATLYDPSSTVYDPNFPGAWHLPGTTSAMRLGGFVNLSLVNSFDPLLIPDRFIVGSIPPTGEVEPGSYEGATVTASQTRVNLEVREQTTLGELRAFVEGDFEGSGDTFRLRHAFGQYGILLAGKTWSNLVDVQSQPEGVDFEGINGMVLVRQSQFRLFPKLGSDLSLRVSMENPQTDIVNGTGATNLADFIVSLDKVPFADLGSWNYRVGVIVRDLEGQYTDGPVPASGSYPTESTYGWGITTGGRWSPSRWDDSNYFLWQLTYGKGVGRYINDLGTIGGGDAVFDPEGQLHALPVFAGYFSYRHVWPRTFKFVQKWPGLFRSNFTFSWVDIDNFDFEDGADYNYTLRASANLMYFPTDNVRFGIEYLWGTRVNKDKSSGDATQLQFSVRYDF